jgi:hypothetical protein
MAVYNAYKAIAEKMAQDKQGGVLLPSDMFPDTKSPMYSIEYVVPAAGGKKAADMTPIIERYDKRMASTVLADFILLGQQAVGSFRAVVRQDGALQRRARGLDAGDRRGLQAPVDSALGRAQRDRSRADAGDHPEDVETPNLTEMASYITALAGAGMPLFPDENLSAHLRQIAGLPEASDEALAAHAQVQENEQQMAEAQLQQAQGDAKLAGKPQPVKKSLRERLVAKFSADQARSPKGSPTGGQWAVRGGADALSEKAMSSGDLEEHVAAGKAHRIAASLTTGAKKSYHEQMAAEHEEQAKWHDDAPLPADWRAPTRTTTEDDMRGSSCGYKNQIAKAKFEKAAPPHIHGKGHEVVRTAPTKITGSVDNSDGED